MTKPSQRPQRNYTPERLAHCIDCSRETVGEVTNQSFKDECDINRVLDRAKHGASLSHLLQHGGSYGDFSTWDENTYEDMQINLARGASIFAELPAELRDEFDNNPGKFYKFVNDPENKDRLEEIFPALSAPGRQLPDVIGRQTAEALVAAVQELASVPENAPSNDASEKAKNEPTPDEARSAKPSGGGSQ